MAYYQAILDADLRLIAAVVDKVDMRTVYGGRAYYAMGVAYEVLLQRVQQDVPMGSVVNVFVDKMTGKSPKGNDHTTMLASQHARLQSHGSTLLPQFRFKGIGPLVFRSSAYDHLIQVADIAAYNVWRQFTDHGDAWEGIGIDTLPTYDYFRKMLTKFRTGPKRVFSGYGVVKFPRTSTTRWRLRDSNKR